ncbi:hypothetical protein KC338_g279 [Hortaea werneckii]|nr:hypothetical protein KC338_g279 [Hortaea werneckii]
MHHAQSTRKKCIPSLAQVLVVYLAVQPNSQREPPWRPEALDLFPADALRKMNPTLAYEPFSAMLPSTFVAHFSQYLVGESNGRTLDVLKEVIFHVLGTDIAASDFNGQDISTSKLATENDFRVNILAFQSLLQHVVDSAEAPSEYLISGQYSCGIEESILKIRITLEELLTEEGGIG